jgi:hypothetical protein
MRNEYDIQFIHRSTKEVAMTHINDHEVVEEPESVEVVHEHDPGRHERIVEDIDMNKEQRIQVYRFTQLIWLLFGILEALLGLRVILKLIAANPANPFASLVFNITQLFVWPFQGLTATPQVGGVVLEINSLIAMLVYAILGWALVKLSWILLYNPTSRRLIHEERIKD